MIGARAITASVTAQKSTRAATTRPHLIRSRLTIPLCAPCEPSWHPGGHAVSEPRTAAEHPLVVADTDTMTAIGTGGVPALAIAACSHSSTRQR